MADYSITYCDDTGAELDAVEIYKGVPIFHCPENDDYFWIADTGKPVYWSCLSHARGGIGSYQVHEHTRAWLSHEKSAASGGVMV